ncbi:MAG: hypothetical protein ICV81_18200 [Flavisolibacter sp.]|nr:hypothetical protein [Flavisolibacter sp.]
MRICLYALFLLVTIPSTAQTISGLYAGTLYNDSTRITQHYELALSEYRGKITGYSYTTFVVNDTFYYGIRRVKATRNDKELVIEDAQMLVNNFPESPAKGVRRITTIPLNGQDSIITLNGRWKTTQTKVYYAVPGSLDMKRDNDSTRSALITHLKELDMLPSNRAGEAERVVKKEEKKQYTNAEEKVPLIAKASLPYRERQQKLLQVVEVNNDSLVLSFYDNGVVDGDSISVYLNGENIISHTRLTGSAYRKIVYLKNIPADSLKLLLVAENLGTLPPNTGLLVVQDGDKRHEVHFSADLQTNATLILRKTKTVK